MECPYCGSGSVKKRGKRKGKQRYLCKVCRRSFCRLDALPQTIDGRVTSLEELLRKFRVDTNDWEVVRWRANSYEQMVKLPDGKPEVVQLCQVKAELRKKGWDWVLPSPIVVQVKERKRASVVEGGAEKILLVPDTQHGYRGKETFHDEAALGLVLTIAAELQPHKVVLLGDHLDLPDWSDKFLAEPEAKYYTQKALNALASWLGQLRMVCPGAQIFYLEGNHEKRLEKALLGRLDAAYGLKKANSDDYPVLSVPFLLDLRAIGIEWVGGYPDSKVWLRNDIVCEHGAVAKPRSGATAQVYLGRSYSTVCGHIHRHELLYFTEFTSGGPTIRFAGSPGTLAKIDGSVPAYSKQNNWQQGIWVLYLEKEDWFVEPVLIHKKQCWWRGKKIRA